MMNDVRIPNERYEELIHAEAQLELVRDMIEEHRWRMESDELTKILMTVIKKKEIKDAKEEVVDAPAELSFV